ncbi:hypothetical protein QVD17_31387 [Tagetes erecta]|uniref:Uncharacterized protein n=1 Tax=Tagetes erecta TaxID=13708 RepID=A0AAD8K4F6_TARER|nr:hypothetical protein QVD17_31387 [Tagetes erecta]
MKTTHHFSTLPTLPLSPATHLRPTTTTESKLLIDESDSLDLGMEKEKLEFGGDGWGCGEGHGGCYPVMVRSRCGHDGGQGWWFLPSGDGVV